MTWSPFADGLELLAKSGRPFDTPAYREAVAEAYPRWRDASFAARQEDGTVAAVALMKIAGLLESVPLGYGGVVSSRELRQDEVDAFLDEARSRSRARSLRLRCVPDLGPRFSAAGGVATGVTSVVRFRPGESWRTSADPKAMYSLRRAQGLNVDVAASSDPAPFLDLYRVFSDPEAMSSQKIAPRKVRHRDLLVEAAAASGIVSFYEVVLDGAVVSATAVLKGAGHWMAWLGAQNEDGRALHGGYVVLARILDDAQAASVPAVNLGGSVSAAGHSLDGVLRVKRRLGAVDLPIVEKKVMRRTAGLENWVRAKTRARNA